MSRRLSLLIAFALAVAGCTGSGDPATTSGGVDPTTTTAASGTTEADASTTTTLAAPSVTPPDLSALELPEAVREQLSGLIQRAQEVRDLAFITPPNIVVVSDEELEARVRQSIEEEAEDFPADEALYKLLGLLGPEADLESLLLDLYGEQVAGFYDGETGEIVVPARDSGFSILQQGTMIHELVHALTDQHFGFDAELRAMVDGERLDEAGAYQALIEGDATLAEVMWVQGLSQAELGAFLAESLEIDTTVFEGVPQFISDSLIFPYDSGLVFVQDLYRGDGWTAVNEAYSLLPTLPGSTEQVITPDDYQRDLPILVELPTIALQGYDLERTSVWGEEAFYTMLDQVLSESASAEAADGWGGDAYHQWYDGENSAFLLLYQGDTERDLEEMRSTLLEFALTSIPEEDFAWVDEEDGILYFIAADVTEVGELIRSSVGLG